MRHVRNTMARPALGFTLVELMVVVGIIALLVAIVVPAVNSARISAKAAASKATIMTIGAGLEQYRADTAMDGAYPPSARSQAVNPHLNNNSSAAGEFVGANFAAWALVGADMLGTPGFRDTDGSGLAADNTGSAAATGNKPAQLYALDNQGKPVYRRKFFVDASKMKFPKQSGTNTTEFILDKLQTTQRLTSICFLDSFNQPILYYRANTTAVQSADNALVGTTNKGVYNLDDNATITGSSAAIAGIDFVGPGSAKLNSPYGNWFHYLPGPSGDYNDFTQPSFAKTIRNPNSTAATTTAFPFRPHNTETFILLSAGPDGRFGSADDIANFEENK